MSAASAAAAPSHASPGAGHPSRGPAPPGSPPGGPPFQSALDELSARTATAEGPPSQSPKLEHRPGAADAPVDAAGGVEATAAAQTLVVASQARGLTAKLSAEGTPHPDAAAAAPKDAGLSTPVHGDSPPPATAGKGIDTAAELGTGHDAGKPTNAPASVPSIAPSGGTSGEPPAPVAKGAAMASSGDSTAASPPAALPLPTSTRESARGASAHATQPDLTGGKAAAGSPSTPVPTLAASAATADSATTPAEAHRLGRGAPGLGLTPNAGVSTSAGAAPAGGASAAESLAPPASAPAISTTQAGAANSYGVDLQQTIEAVQATLELATRQGLSSARIALAPAELGEIRIHLTQSASGLVARLTASTPAAAQALGEGRSELRESLHSLGLTALHLDTATFQSGAQGREGHAPRHTADLAVNHRTNAHDEEVQGDEPTLPEPTRTSEGPHSRGALVDVLA